MMYMLFTGSFSAFSLPGELEDNDRQLKLNITRALLSYLTHRGYCRKYSSPMNKILYKQFQVDWMDVGSSENVIPWNKRFLRFYHLT